MNKIQRIFKAVGVPYCWHKWECVNSVEVKKGYKPVYRCKKCGEYLR